MDESSVAVPLGLPPAVWPGLVTRILRYSPREVVYCSLSGSSSVLRSSIATVSTNDATGMAADVQFRTTMTNHS